jgi:hypothetical protein
MSAQHNRAAPPLASTWCTMWSSARWTRPSCNGWRLRSRVMGRRWRCCSSWCCLLRASSRTRFTCTWMRPPWPSRTGWRRVRVRRHGAAHVVGPAGRWRRRKDMALGRPSSRSATTRCKNAPLTRPCRAARALLRQAVMHQRLELPLRAHLRLPRQWDQSAPGMMQFRCCLRCLRGLLCGAATISTLLPRCAAAAHTVAWPPMMPASLLRGCARALGRPLDASVRCCSLSARCRPLRAPARALLNVSPS